jgi:phosphoribosylformimino-5-aminoimidazole carboxamide ribonucleotide (ProFAR) isomerase
VDVKCLEETVEAGGGRGAVAVGEAADSIGADLVVVASAAVHDKHVDANLLAEMVDAPVLLLP